MSALSRLTAAEIARWRLYSQRLVGSTWLSADDVVGGLLAVQAENYSQAGWAIACRCAVERQVTFDRAFDEGRFLRTHVIRPTWHFVLPDDIVWLIELTAPRIKGSFVRAQQQMEGIDDDERDRLVSSVIEAIDKTGPMTRADVQTHLAESGLRSSGNAVTLALGIAESDAVVCSGPRRGGTQTYAMLADRAPKARRLDRGDALAELALRYVAGHGPVTERDLAYWATLTLTDLRAGLASVSDQLDSFENDGRTYWILQGAEPPALPSAPEPTAHILQILDEMYRGYQESRMLLDEAGITPRERGASIGMALIDGQIVAGMKRRMKSTSMEIALEPFRPLTAAERAAFRAVAEDYGRYCDLEAILTINQV